MSGEKQPKTAAEPVGQQLRRAREREGLSLSAIADQQHLRISVIQAIEDGEFSKVDTELFLKGYVRAYARHVGLDADAIIHDLDEELEPLREERERQHDADPLVDIERKKRRKQRVARAIIVVLIIAAIGFAVSFYLADGSRSLPGFSADQAPGASESLSEAETDNTEAQLSDPQPGVSLPEAPDTGVGTGNSPEDTGSEADASDVMVLSEVAEEEGTATPGTEKAPEQDPVVTASEMPGTVFSEPESEPEVVTDPATVTGENAVSSAQLRMSFNDDCWVQVSDAQGNRLASTLQTSGDVLEVSGEAPLSIVVGAMSALDSLEFQGEPVDLNSIRAVNNRAEFTLEP